MSHSPKKTKKSTTPFPFKRKNNSTIFLLGVGNGGGNMLNHIVNEMLRRQKIEWNEKENAYLFTIDNSNSKIKKYFKIQFTALNSDQQALDGLQHVPHKILLKDPDTHQSGNGAGGQPEIGRRQAEKSLSKLERAFPEIQKKDIVILIVGLGGGTGSGAAPVIGQYFKKRGALTLSILTYPFQILSKNLEVADKSIKEIQEAVDANLLLQNDAITKLEGTLSDAFKMIDHFITNMIIFIITVTFNNFSFKVDLINLIKNSEKSAFIGYGYYEGKNALQKAFEQAQNSPLLGNLNMLVAKKLIVAIKAPYSTTVEEIIPIISAVKRERSYLDFSFIEDYPKAYKDKAEVIIIAGGLEH